MRKILTFLVCLAIAFGAKAQQEQIYIHSNGSVIYQNGTSTVENMKFSGHNAVVNAQQGSNTFAITSIDSITLGKQELPPPGDMVIITFNGNTVDVENPFSNAGVTVNTNNANVVVNSTKSDVTYKVLGSSSNGSVTFYSNFGITLQLYNLTLTSSTAAAIEIVSEINTNLILTGATTLADGANGGQKGAFCTAGSISSLQSNGTLNLTGNAKHGLAVEGNLIWGQGTLNITQANSDALHIGAFTQSGGNIHVENVGSDGIDCSTEFTLTGGNISISNASYDVKGIKAGGNINLNGGSINITSTAEEYKAIKGDANVVVNNQVEMNLAGQGSNGISSDIDITIGSNASVTITSSSTDGKCLKSDGTVHINGGTVNLSHSGDMSKGISATGDITIADGDITITASGSTVLQQENNQNVPSYCTAIKGDANINIQGGTFHITLPTSNHGGKSISADANLSISDGDFTIETHGDGAAYTISGDTKDSYTSSCLKSDGNMEILAGQFTLTSTGLGGKGINAGGTLVIGQQGTNNDNLILSVTTTGERITVSSGGGGGGGWPPGPGGEGDYANPKAIKSEGNLTINSGNINVLCSQTQNEGGECIESKATLTINGGNIEAYSKKDDGVNAANNITINGGTYYVHSDGNDGTDSNGTMFLNGGFLISNGTRQPEEGFDCDNNQFKVTGGTIIGTGGGTSSPTQNVCTQPSLKINTQPGYAIQILTSSGEVIATYQCPTFTGGGGGGGPGGGGNSMVMLFSDPQLHTGNSYTVKYGGTISGGTNVNGYYTGNVTYSGGQQTNVNVNSMLTTVSAGGGGW